MTNAAKCMAGLALGTLLLGGRSASAAETVRVRQATAFDLSELGRDFPAALETFKRADAAAAAGLPEEALSLFEEAGRLAPTNPAPLRRSCEILTELGRVDAAMTACNKALAHSDWPEELRALVGALMMPARSAPTSDELFRALSIAGGISGNHPHLVAGHAAMFEIAARMGDHRLMKTHLRELERVAPDGYDTWRARRMVAALGPTLPVVLAWMLIAAACAATLARSLVRWRSRPRVLAKAAACALLVSVLGGAPAHAAPAAGHLSEFQIDDADPEASIPDRTAFRKDPLQFGYLIMDLADRADFAIKRNKDYAAAVRYYKALIKTVPDRAIGYAKVCETFEAAGDRQSALAYCRQALVHDGVRTDDYDRFVRLALAGEGPLADADKVAVITTIDYLRKARDGAIPAADIECQLGVRVSDVARLERCTKELASLAPESTNNIGYRWSLAILKRDTAGAREILGQAKQAGFDVTGLERMTKAAQQAAVKRALSFGLAAVLIIGAGVLMYRRRREVFAGLLRRSAS